MKYIKLVVSKIDSKEATRRINALIDSIKLQNIME